MRIGKTPIKFIFATLLAALGMGLGGAVSVWAAPTIYYVATNGDDTWSGQLPDPNGSGDGPWRTIQHAATATAPGDTIEVRVGTYNESVGMDVGYSGTSSAPKIFTTYNNEQVTLDGAWYPTTWIRDPDSRYPNIWYTDASGIDFGSEGQARLVWQDEVPLQYTDTANLVDGTWWYDTGTKFLYVWMRGGGDPNNHIAHIAVQALQDAFTLNTASWITLDGFHIVHYFRGIEQLDSSGSPTPATMEGLTVRNCLIEHVGEGIILGGGNVGAWGITNNGLIEKNTVKDTQGDGIWVGNGTGHVVRRNSISDVKQAWYSLLIPAAILVGSGNTRVENNIIYNPLTIGILVNTEGGPAVGNTIVNNTIYHADDHGISIDAGPLNPTAVPSNTVIGNNIFDDLPSAEAINDLGTNTSADYDLFSQSSDLAALQPGQEANGISGDPLFVSAGSDFRLLAGSPAIDAGSNILAPAEDFFGTPRPMGAAADIGAVEYIPPLTPTQTSTPTDTPTASATSTDTPPATMTDTPSPVSTPGATVSATPTVSPTAGNTSTATLTSTLAPFPTSTPSMTLTPTIAGSTTPTRTLTATPSPTPTRTQTRTPSRTPTRTRTRTRTPLRTFTRTRTPIHTVVLSATASPSPSASPFPTLSPSRTSTRTAIVTASEIRTPTLSPMETPSISNMGGFPQPTSSITATSQASGSSTSGTGLSSLLRDSRFLIIGIAVLLIVSLAALVVWFFSQGLEQGGNSRKEK